MIKIGILPGVEIELNEYMESAMEQLVTTPYGDPSSKVITGRLSGKEVVIIKRHGDKDEIPSFQVNNKANLFALHKLGCTHILASSVCGSLQEEIMVEELVVFDQFIDLTTHRELSYSDKLDHKKLNHSAFHKPFSDEVRDALIEAAVIKGYTIHTKGTVLAVDGPRQSTRAESNLFRRWKADVVNTTTAPEAILAHEIGIQYGAISLCTYYDTWRTDIKPASRDEKMEVIRNCRGMITDLLLLAIDKI
ncbi:MAG: MTAP family purine nucleoside phosphorylase [Bacteroidales bacterium]|nr:MTAP family purine nucleoside phosphorylase [Bacteroidales bacterium]